MLSVKFNVKQIPWHSTCQLLPRCILHVLPDQFKTSVFTKSIGRVLHLVPFRHSVTGISIRHGITHHAACRANAATATTNHAWDKHSYVGFTPSLFRPNTLTIPPLFSESVFPDSQEWTSQRNQKSGALSKHILSMATAQWRILFHKKRSVRETMSTNSQEPRVGTVTRLSGGQPRMSASATGRGKRLPFL